MSKEGTETAVGGLPLYPTGLSRTELDLKGGRDFWNCASRIIDQSSLGSQVDVIMSGKAAPRVWAFVAESGQSAVAVAAALSCAAILAERGQSVILLDGDDNQPDLTRWAGRFELEGWIDLVRYGASLMTSSIPMELPGRKSLLIGVGSFCPTQVTEEEIDELLGRLRRRADDILIIVPAGERGRPWAVHAQMRLLSWDQSSRSAKAAQEAINRLNDRGIELTGLIGFGSETDDAVAARLRPADGTATPHTPTDATAATSASDLAQATEQTVEAVAAAAAAEATALDTAAAQAATADTDETAATAGTDETAGTTGTNEQPGDFWSTEDAPRRTSGVFWWLATAFVICAAAAGIYYFKFLDRDPAPSRSVMVPESVVSAAATPGGDELVTDAELPGSDELAGGDELSASDELVGGTALSGDAESDAAEEVSGGQMDGNGASASDAASVQPATVQPPPSSVAESTVADDAPAGTDDTVFSDANARLYQVPVGQDGWTLHLYSFPENDLAQAQVIDLERRGYRAAIRTVDLPDKGRWYRVYVGSFASRDQALAARPELLQRLDTDWAMPFGF